MINNRLVLILLVAVVVGMKAAPRSGARQVLTGTYKGYLFAYFEGAGEGRLQEHLRFAVSKDACHWHALNDNAPIILSDTISKSGGIRDPHILRGEDGCFYLVATDMNTVKNGWTENPGIVMMKSRDLINWSHAFVDLPHDFASHFADAYWVWAPQTIYDHEAGKYMVYFTLQRSDRKSLITYYAYANRDFTGFESEPKQLFDAQYGSIDNDINYKDGVYHLFYKGYTKDANGKETKNGIKQATSRSLHGPWKECANYVDAYAGKTLVEGSSIFRLNDSDKYVLMYDLYTTGRYEYQTSTDLYHFSIKPQSFEKDFFPRHGSVISVTSEELERLQQQWGYVPFDNVNNPVLPWYHADPEILYAEQTGRYYIYPTNDGHDNWMGTDFSVFSSSDLKHWNDEGIILDVKKDVSWANGRAWAPCIIERREPSGNYKYYYYFCADQKIGVATADRPEGPFKDALGQPLISGNPKGQQGGQEIDPDVFCDPVSGKYYLYWGNYYMAGVELNDDMISYDPDSVVIMTPKSNYTEGTYVFYRNGRYYFLWSENDTRDENYRVRYATAISPLGPLEIPDDNIILSKRPELGIYATGHNAVIQKPGTDEWYIVYHRFRRPNAVKMGWAAGYHREVCIDRMEFNIDGSIRKITPTL
ncbi:MAG: family 43 glycosylhydrolase [Prevotella sp.]|nr:family 43 glycosylhydrolase [Prevotella sp.]